MAISPVRTVAAGKPAWEPWSIGQWALPVQGVLGAVDDCARGNGPTRDVKVDPRLNTIADG